MVNDLKSFLAAKSPSSPTVRSPPPLSYSDDDSGFYTSPPKSRPAVSFAAKPEPDTFSKLSTMFGFTHQEGTDRVAEVSVVKHVMKREDLLMKLHHMNNTLLNIFKDVIVGSNSTRNSSSPTRLMNDRMCSEILQLLSQIRETTLSYLEALCLWRQTSYTLSPSPLLPPVPRPFYWKGNNYTLKIMSDLDFLVDNDILMNGLLSNIIPPEQVRCNPLMLTNNLEDPDTWMDPYERAVKDTMADGAAATEGPHFEAKLRLRYAERVILQEIEIASNNVEGDASTIKSEKEESLSKFRPSKYGRRLPGKEGELYSLNIPLYKSDN